MSRARQRAGRSLSRCSSLRWRTSDRCRKGQTSSAGSTRCSTRSNRCVRLAFQTACSHASASSLVHRLWCWPGPAAAHLWTAGDGKDVRACRSGAADLAHPADRPHFALRREQPLGRHSGYATRGCAPAERSFPPERREQALHRGPRGTLAILLLRERAVRFILCPRDALG